MNLAERLANNSTPVPEAGCFVWLGSTQTRHGLTYGRLRVGTNGAYLAHRASYEITKGTIPDGMELDHLCRNTLCVNPDHLEAVTHQVNCARGKKAQQTHCLRGHEYTEANTYRHKSGGRYCRTCFLERANKKEKEKREATGQPWIRGAKRTHCKRGHPAIEANENYHGRRRCRICANMKQMERYRRKHGPYPS